MNLKVIWENMELYGCEYLKLGSTKGECLVESTVIYMNERETDAFNVNYRIELNETWLTKNVCINVEKGNNIKLNTDGEGNWFNNNGELIENLKGAIDIDISATPFSNSLPINRIIWHINQIEHFHMVYISVPSLEIKKVPQSYHYIRKDGELRYFKYRCYDYETIICVDSNGLVVDYPNTFKRRL
ncbi:hypothetical protein OBCHQ24_16865 [Oceanobacillus iheyensis]|nr:hypothetical protein OBCHQ24_16865 [Oceanobacillus iheyensis]